MSVTVASETVCHADGWWKIGSNTNEEEIQWMQNRLADLKARIEKADQRR